ncbi:hypothetical protein HYALB_00004783 [Hymenoscyphus albidus]|uniref:Uncharacterized protein n=1 Tax=Hymenoscyphus albidus TaxID=595503 RepID=A0A9N9Q5I0_9HELO|nr:hypothetical protein HYALB_00004783 [Hymenoscyphus albidus]
MELTRLQFMGVKEGKGTWGRVLGVGDVGEKGGDGNGNEWMVAFLDLEMGPNTEMWVYSSLERRWGMKGGADAIRERSEESPVSLKDQISAPQEELLVTQLRALLKRVKEIERQYVSDGATEQRANEGVVLMGSLHANLLGVLEKRGRG